MALQMDSRSSTLPKDEDSDTTDDEMYDDDYRSEKAKFASSDKGNKQAGTASLSALDELTVVNRAKDIDEIQRFIGRIKIAWKGLDSDTYYYGTGTTFQHLNGKYYVILTCAHNLLRQKGQPAINLYFLPEGNIDTESDEKKDNKSPKIEPRLQCIAWEHNPKYNPEMRHCPNDIGVILCYDGHKYYKKLDLDDNVDDIIQIAVNAKKTKIKRCNIYGYPIGCEGTLRGTKGSAKIGEENSGEWQYNIYTFPGHSGSAMYVWNSEKDIFQIYGVHTFGDMAEQKNMGVRLTEEHKQWINEAVQKRFIPAMDRDKGQRAQQRKQKKKEKASASDLKQFLESLGVAEYYQNFVDRGCDKMMDLEDETHQNLESYFVITDYGHRKKILKGIKTHFGDEQSIKLEQQRIEKERLQRDKLAQMEEKLKLIERESLEKEKRLKVEQEKAAKERLEKERLLQNLNERELNEQKDTDQTQKMGNKWVFFLSCSDLTAHNAFIGVFLKDAATQEWIELGRTEVSYNSNPKYAKQFIVDFIFEEEQQLRFDIYRSMNNNTAFIAKNVIGSAAFKLSEVVHAKDQMVTRTLTKGRKVLKNRESKRYSRMNLRLEPLNTEADFVDTTAFEFKATNLPKQGAFSKCNAILEIHRLGSDGKFFKVWESNVIKKSLSPKWPQFTLTTTKLCNGDTNRTLQLKIYHCDKANRKYIGKCQSNYNKLLNANDKHYALKDKKGKQVGMLVLGSISVLSRQQNPNAASNANTTPDNATLSTQYQKAENAAVQSGAVIEEKMQQDMMRKLQVQKSLRSRSKFLEYLETSELSLMIAIDFTGSNGKPNDPRSLHHIYKQFEPSPYQDALRRISSIVAPYDSDQKFPVWGFGAKFPQMDNVLHEFPVNLNPKDEEVDGVNGIEQAYLNAIQSNAFQLSGPCCYSYILTKAINEAIVSHNEVMQSETEKIQYYILLILTNGQCSDADKQQTKNRLIYASNNNLPLSVIFIGIGDNDFKFLNELDGDFEPIKNDKGNTAQRDIVQFVAMKDFKNKPKNELSKYTLREVPIQFVSYVDNNHLKPRKNQNFGLKRAESKFYEEDEDDSGFAHYKGDTMFQISQDELNAESEEEEDLKQESQPGSTTTADPMANVPVPMGWEKSYTASGKPFYINHSTKSTQWTHPLKGKMNRSKQSEQTELQKKQAAAYNVQMMNNQFDNGNSHGTTQIVNKPLQRSATFQPQMVYAQPQAQQSVQKSQTMYQQPVQRSNTFQPQVQVPQQPKVVYVDQYGRPVQQQPQQVRYVDQYGRPVQMQQQQQPQQVQYAQPQQNRYAQPQQAQQVNRYAQPQQVQYVQGQPQQGIVYSQPQQQYGQPQQQYRKYM